MMKLNDLLFSILDKLKEEVDELPAPASQDLIDDISKSFEEIFKVSLPDQYIEILKISDGLIYNGLTIWPTHRYWHFKESMLEANLSLQELYSQDYIYFGKRDEELYVYNPDLKTYSAIEYVGEAEWEVFSSAEEMFEFMLQRSLD